VCEVRVVAADEQHIEAILPHVRAADHDEAEAWAGSLETALRGSVCRSLVAFAVLFGDQVAVLYGIGGQGEMWLITADVVDQYPLTFWRECKRQLADIRAIWARPLHASIDARYTKSIAWAKRLGFSIGEARPQGVQQLPFHRVWLEA
jgi:hypothetical protein